ncbi:hypothetical protein C3495_02020 [Clostridiaceae bacterium 14S0207]|nr:hypothetical protein C3495_02020 [Clostridiaceae bacterium 14S0207]
MEKKKIILTVAVASIMILTVTTMVFLGHNKKENNSATDKIEIKESKNDNKFNGENKGEQAKIEKHINKEESKNDIEKQTQNEKKEIENRNSINEKKNTENNKHKVEKSENKKKDNIKLDVDKVDLDSEKDLINLISKAFKKYYGVNVPTDGSIKFKLKQPVVQENKGDIISADWVGKLNETQYYLNIVINKGSKKIERIDMYDYSIEEKENEISEEEAKKIAEDFFKRTENEKLKDIESVTVLQSSKDGYSVVFKKKNFENNKQAIIIAVNPYASVVSSFSSYWD